MWLREAILIEVADNTVTPIGLQFWDEAANAPLDITGWSFVCNIAQADGETKLASFAGEIADATTGEIDVTFDGRLLIGNRTLSGQLIAVDEVGESVTAARIILLVNEGIE